MIELRDVWQSLPAGIQDALWILGLLLPVLLLALIATTGFRVRRATTALLRGQPGSVIAFLLLISLSVGIAQAVALQERAVRSGSARAAEAFDVIVTTPTGDVTALLATVFLQAGSLPLLPGEVLDELRARDDVAMAAPLAFGDSVEGHPIVGTTQAMIESVLESSGVPAATRASLPKLDSASDGASTPSLVGAATAFEIGEELVPAHGLGNDPDVVLHSSNALTVKARLPSMGSPWDRAVFVSVEAVWLAHGLGYDLHKSESDGEHDLAASAGSVNRWTPGVSAIVVRPVDLGAAYTIRGEFTNARSMAFFPGEVLLRLHGLLGNVEQLVSRLALVLQALVVVSVLLALGILLRSLAPRFALLRALGAPQRFVFAVVWCFGFTLVLVGSLLGVLLGYLLATGASQWLSLEYAIDLSPDLHSSDLIPVAGIVLAGALLALIPAIAAARRESVNSLRS